MIGARDVAIERLASVLMDASAEGYGALRRTVTEAEEIGASTLARSDATTRQGMAERAREVMRLLGLVAVDPAMSERLRVEHAACAGRVAYESDEGDMSTSYGSACADLADAILEQLEPAR